MKNCITIDVEDWFHNMFLNNVISISDWDKQPTVAEKGLDKILNILSKNQTTATFFILGWMAERYPGICEKIVAGGHDIATHGYYHKLVYEQTPEEFERELSNSIDIIKKYNLEYDSSIYPTTGLVLCGMPKVPRIPFNIIENFIEIPLSIYKAKVIDFPVSGGFYLRSYPFCIYKSLVKRVNKVGIPVVIYIHPWEFCDEFPRKIRNTLWQWTQIYNIHSMEGKLDNLLSEFEFGSIEKSLLVR